MNDKKAPVLTLEEMRRIAKIDFTSEENEDKDDHAGYSGCAIVDENGVRLGFLSS